MYSKIVKGQEKANWWFKLFTENEAYKKLIIIMNRKKMVA